MLVNQFRILPILCLLSMLGCLTPAWTQSTPDPKPEDVATLDGIMRAYYEVVSRPAGQPADRQRDRSLHYPGARVAITGADDQGKPYILAMTLDQYHDNYGGAMTQGFYEWEIQRETQRFGNVAQVWSTYATATTPDGTPTERGINTIQLYYDGSRWWIMSWLFDSERAGNPIPSDFLPNRGDWMQLFNGKDLSGWTPKIRGYEAGVNFGNTFRVEEGLLKVRYDQYENFDNRFGHLFFEKPFSYYKLRVEYRFVGEQAPGGPDWAYKNSGIMVHGQPVESMGKDQDFPISIEVQLLGGRTTGNRSTCNLCTPGTNVVMNDSLFTPHCINSRSATYRGDEWVTAEVLVLGDSLIQHIVNGEVVLSYTHPQIGGGAVSNLKPGFLKMDGQLLSGGSISLQSESHPVEFRTVEILNLEGCMDPKARNYRPYFVKADNSKCTY